MSSRRFNRFSVNFGMLANTYRAPIGNSSTTGIIEQEDGDMYFLRGLAAVLRLGGELPADLRDTIKIVLGVHYNAIRDYASFRENLYGRSWSPDVLNSGSFDMYNQAAAAQVFVDGIDLFEETNSPSPSTPTFIPPPSSKTRTGVIVGATIGSVVFVSMSAIAAFVFLHRHRWRRAAPSPEFTSQIISPFHGEKSGQPHPRASHWHAKNRSDPPGSADSRGNEAGSVPLIVPAHSEGTPPSESDEHLGNNMGGPGTRREDDREEIAAQMELTPGFPDMVRAVYQRLWERDGSEAPPDYLSNAGGVCEPLAEASSRDI
ncbi:hypothetical protein V5O48_002109 [Marasmius crinis-equi]|uniref:Uncharacterized protein n=1 Tax=Marasmius crinis-equi TaxID=585013 RepID=A0ABR3FXM8_9AGAR